MTKKRYLAVVMLAFFTVSSYSDDRAMFRQYAPPPVQESAPIERALARIIPAPYRIMLDDAVPGSLALVWKRGDNWMEVLTAALAPIGLQAVPDWNTNTITVTWKERPSAPPAQVAAAPAAPQSAPDAPDPKVAAPAGMSGSFEFFAKDDSVGADSLAPVGQVRDFFIGKKKAFPAEEFVVIVVKPGGGLEGSNIWKVMKAAALGSRVVLTGYSGAIYEKNRVRYANQYAATLRAKLLGMGMPPEIVTVNERAEYRTAGDFPHVEIVLRKGKQ